MNKIYLAGRYERRAELAEYAEVLRCMGNHITSTWLDGTHEADDKAPTFKQKCQWANKDLDDIEGCNIFIAFTDNVPGRGGRHFECGYATGLNKMIIVVGEEEDNIFYAGVPRYETFYNFLNSNENLLKKAQK